MSPTLVIAKAWKNCFKYNITEGNKMYELDNIGEEMSEFVIAANSGSSAEMFSLTISHTSELSIYEAKDTFHSPCASAHFQVERK